MRVSFITCLLILLFIYPILKGFMLKFSSNDLKYDMQQLESNISFVAALILAVYASKEIFIRHEKGIFKALYNLLPANMTLFIESNPSILYFVIIPIMLFIFYKILYMLLELLNKITVYPILDSVEEFLKTKSNGFKRVCGAFFQLPKAICYILLLAFILNIISMFKIGESLNKYLEQSEPYKYICKEIVIPITNSKVAKQLPNIVNNSFKVVEKKESIPSSSSGFNNVKTIIYYNGVTLEDGIKSNNQIDTFARKLVSGENDDRQKAKRIYNWIGSNISYDNEKASRVLNNDFNIKSGAIPTFQTRTGICFDYSCLYVAMCRANGLKVRLVTGEGFNGVSWVSHAWNEVFIGNEGKWVNVDTTFYKGGNYFDSRRFDRDHKDSKIVGEW